MSAEENKALVRRFYAELDALNASVIEELVAEDFVNHSPPPFPVEPGREGLKQAFELFRRATPGSHEILDQVAEGDKVVTRLRAVGTHESDLPGVPRTGNTLEMRRPSSTGSRTERSPRSDRTATSSRCCNSSVSSRFQGARRS